MASLKECYKSDGELVGDVPCDPNAAVSACCRPDSVCVTNLYCIDFAGNKVPGTCTDQGWGSLPNPACPCPARKIAFSLIFTSHIQASRIWLTKLPSTRFRLRRKQHTRLPRQRDFLFRRQLLLRQRQHRLLLQRPRHCPNLLRPDGTDSYR